MDSAIENHLTKKRAARMARFGWNAKLTEEENWTNMDVELAEAYFKRDDQSDKFEFLDFLKS